MKVPGAAGLAQWAREHTRAFHRSLWDFCNDQFFFVEAISPAGFPVSLSHGYNMQGGRMTVSTLILILLLTFTGAGALERLRSTLIK
jgi:hypothetical protein